MRRCAEDEELDVIVVAKQLGISEEEVLELAKDTPLGSSEKLSRLGALVFAELNPEES